MSHTMVRAATRNPLKSKHKSFFKSVEANQIFASTDLRRRRRRAKPELPASRQRARTVAEATQRWGQKVDPEFVEWVFALREMEQIRRQFPRDLTPAQMRQLADLFNQRFGKRYSEMFTPVRSPAAQIYLGIWDRKSSEIHALDFLCRFQLGIRLEKLFSAHQKLDFAASWKLENLFEEIKDWRAGRRLKEFKSNTAHNIRFEFGISHGLADLSPKQMKDFFDDVCGCGRPHDAELLRQERHRKLGSGREIEQWLDYASGDRKFDHTEAEREHWRPYRKGHALELTYQWTFLRMNPFIEYKKKINGRWKTKRVKTSSDPRTRKWLEKERPKQRQSCSWHVAQVRLRWDAMPRKVRESISQKVSAAKRK